MTCFEEAAKKGDEVAKYYLGYFTLKNASRTDSEEEYAKAADLFREVIQKNPNYA